jgi:hypothetical protein
MPSMFLLRSMTDESAETYTLSLLEQLRAQCARLQAELAQSYARMDGLIRQINNPNLHDLPMQMPFRVEMWTGDGQHIRWVTACAGTISIAHGAYDAAVKNFPNERWTLRNGILVVREYPR